MERRESTTSRYLSNVILFVLFGVLQSVRNRVEFLAFGRVKTEKGLKQLSFNGGPAKRELEGVEGITVMTYIRQALLVVVVDSHSCTAESAHFS